MRVLCALRATSAKQSIRFSAPYGDEIPPGKFNAIGVVDQRREQEKRDTRSHDTRTVFTSVQPDAKVVEFCTARRKFFSFSFLSVR